MLYFAGEEIDTERGAACCPLPPETYFEVHVGSENYCLRMGPRFFSYC
jgi:hypothetical protein